MTFTTTQDITFYFLNLWFLMFLDIQVATALNAHENILKKGKFIRLCGFYIFFLILLLTIEIC